MTVFVARRDSAYSPLSVVTGSLLLPLVKKNTLKFSAYISWTVVLSWNREVVVKVAQFGFGGNFWLTLERAIQKESLGR
jgi:hypothetical protein